MRMHNTQCTGMLKTLFGRTTHNTQYTYAMHRNPQNPLWQDNAQHAKTQYTYATHRLVQNWVALAHKGTRKYTMYTYTMHNPSQERVCERTKQCANTQPLNALRKREMTRLDSCAALRC